MIEGAKWRRWAFFYVPLGVFIFGLLFPFYWMLVTTFRPDAELYRPWMAPNYTPFWTLRPTLDHINYLLGETLFRVFADDVVKLLERVIAWDGRSWSG